MIELTKQDYGNLWNTAMKWKENNWVSQINGGRFTNDADGRPASDWEWAYWFDDYSSLLWARLFLIRTQIPFELTYDTNIDEWVILTNQGVEK